MTESIKMTNAALDEYDGDIILRGVIDPASLTRLRVDDYQREILPMTRIRDLAEAIRKGGVPDIELGMRGGSFLEREGAFYLQDEVFIIDGLQRRTAALEVLKGGAIPRLGATVHFNTRYRWEKERFDKLNMARVKVSPNVLLRNQRKEIEAIEMLYRLCNDSTFVLGNRVCWDQRMKREHLIGGLSLLKYAASLHRRFGLGLGDNSFERIATGFQSLYDRLGRGVLRGNIMQFWKVIDECFNVRGVAYVVKAPQLKKGFLYSMSRVFANHEDFWTDCNFVCSTDIRKKLTMFPIHDPHVASLCSTSGASRKILYEMLIQHINSGKRSRRLTPFEDADAVEEQPEEGAA